MSIIINKPAERRTEEPVVSSFLHGRARAGGVPLSGTFELTSRCNFSCPMCYVHNEQANCTATKELPGSWWIKTAAAAVEQGMLFLLLTGGEPFLHKDFESIYKELKKLGLIVSINTNGYYLPDRIIELFKKEPPNRVNVSLYGTDNDVYERFTGVRGFERVTENISLLRSLGIDVRLNCSITKDNFLYADAINRYADENGLFLKMTPYMYPKIRTDGVFGENSKRLSPEDASLCRVNMLKYKKTDSQFIRYAEALKNGSLINESDCFTEDEMQKVRCRAGFSSFWINSEGKMSMCGIVDKDFDVEQMGFSAAWENVKKHTLQIRLPEKCVNCPYRCICNVCAAVCYTESGDFSRVPDYVCKFSEISYSLILDEAERLRQKNGN